VLLGRNRESRSREAAGRRNWPEAVPRKNERQKKASLLNWEHRCGLCRGKEAGKGEQQHSALRPITTDSTMVLDSSGLQW